MNETTDYIKKKIKDFIPEIGIVLGSGLGEFGDNFEGLKIPYKEIPGFETPSVEGHCGNLIFTEIEKKNCILMQGRYHYYEGFSLAKVTYPIVMMAQLGIKNLILTNAAGGISDKLVPGNLMLLTDHINLIGSNPLIGQQKILGQKFSDMSDVYKKYLRELAYKIAKDLNINLKEGVYAALSGPSYETPAEIKMLKIFGADACGMSTVPEAIVANHLGIDVLGISCITNLAAGISKEKLSHNEVIETANAIKTTFKILIQNIIKNI